MRTYLGKFEVSGRLGESLCRMVGDGYCEDEVSIGESGEWYGRINFRRAVAICHQDSQGFFDVDLVDHDKADKAWQEITDDVEECNGPQSEDYIIVDNPRGGYEVSIVDCEFIGQFSEYDDCLDSIRDSQERHKCYSNSWLIDDHGGYRLVSL